MNFRVGDKVVWSKEFTNKKVDPEKVYTVSGVDYGVEYGIHILEIVITDPDFVNWSPRAWRKVDDIKLQKELAEEAVKYVVEEKNKQKQLEEV